MSVMLKKSMPARGVSMEASLLLCSYLQDVGNHSSGFMQRMMTAG